MGICAEITRPRYSTVKYKRKGYNACKFWVHMTFYFNFYINMNPTRTKRGQHATWTDSTMKLAVKAVLMDQRPKTSVAKQYGIPRQTFIARLCKESECWRWCGKVSYLAANYTNQWSGSRIITYRPVWQIKCLDYRRRWFVNVYSVIAKLSHRVKERRRQRKAVHSVSQVTDKSSDVVNRSRKRRDSTLGLSRNDSITVV